MKLIVISSPHAVANEVQHINALFDAGLEILHLRKPQDSISHVASLLSGIKPDNLPKIALHQHHQLASDFNIKRLHYPVKARLISRLAEREDLKRRGFSLSTSVHGIDELKKLQQFDYVFLGPVFESISKPGYRTTQDFKSLINLKNIPFEVVALGGIMPKHLNDLADMGFNGAAALGGIWQQNTPPINCFKLYQQQQIFKSIKQ